MKVKKIPVAIRKQDNTFKDEELSAQQGILHFTPEKKQKASPIRL